MITGQSQIKKRSFNMNGHKTSVSMEDAFWDEVVRIAGEKGLKIGEYLAAISQRRLENQTLSSAIRCEVLKEVRLGP